MGSIGIGLTFGNAGVVDPLEGGAHEGRGGIEAELVLDAGAVGFDGFGVDAEGGGDLFGALAVADEFEHLEFAVAEGLDGGAMIAAGRGDAAEEDLGGHGGAEVDLTGEDAAHGVEEFGFGGGLAEVTEGTGFEDTFGVDFFVLGGEDEHARWWGHEGAALDQFEAVAIGQPEVDDDEVGFELEDICLGVTGGIGGAADFEAEFVADVGCEVLMNDGMILDDVDTCLGRLGGLGRLGAHGRPDFGDRTRGRLRNFSRKN